MQVPQQFQVLSASDRPVNVSVLGQVPYQQVYIAMIEFTTTRKDQTIDQIWFVEHPPVYTQGTACHQKTILPSDIPVVQTDRGGQITYHGPGQIMMYPLLSLRRFELGVKTLVSNLEQSVIDTLSGYGVIANRREGAPGVYVDEAKIAALGLRIKRGKSYHGLSFNINMDLTPFANIDPCGYQGLEVTQLANLKNIEVDVDTVLPHLLRNFIRLI